MPVFFRATNAALRCARPFAVAVALAGAFALTTAAPGVLGAQQTARLRVGAPAARATPTRPAPVVLEGVALRPGAGLELPVASDEKSATAGVLLSGLVFPGLGSFYAGNDRHGWIHAGITVAAIVGTLAASGSCRRNCPNENGVVVLGLSTLVVNDIWSMFTAAHDVAAANAARSKSP